MNARRLLIILVTLAGLLIVLSSLMAVRQQGIVKLTNALMQSFSALESWQALAEVPGASKESVLEQSKLVLNLLPDQFASIATPTSEWSNFFLDERPLADVLDSALALKSTLIDELLYCHRIQNRYGFFLNIVQMLLIALFIAIGLLSYFMGRRAQDYRLAPFPEANPNPVFGLNYGGDVIYINNAVKKNLEHFMPHSTDPRDLLPAEFQQRLTSLKRSNKRQGEWLHQVGERTFQYRVQLLPALERIHIYSEDVTEKENIRARNAFIAFHDPVCLLANRQRLEQIIDDLSDPQQIITLVITNVQGISTVLSTQGLGVADQFTRESAIRLRSAFLKIASAHHLLRKPVVFRFDSNLFGCLFFHPLHASEHEELKKQLQQSLQKPFYHSEREYFFSLKSGVASESSTVSARQIIQQANLALHSLSDNEQIYQIYNEQIEEVIQGEQRLEQSLRHALEFNELSMYYQPQQDLHSGRLIGFEALMRWQLQDGLMIPPNHFIPVAEKNGLIHSLGHWGLTEVLQQSLQWQVLALLNNASVAVNVSAHEFSRRDYIADVEQALITGRYKAETVQLELTESLLIKDERLAIEKMHQLKALGFTLAIDDFGTGYSSFNYLSRFPVDKLKIDRSFIHNMTKSLRDEAIVTAMVEVAHQLGLKVIAEGVETEAQKQRLLQIGCDQIQGYLYAKPMTAADVAIFLTKQMEDV